MPRGRIEEPTHPRLFKALKKAWDRDVFVGPHTGAPWPVPTQNEDGTWTPTEWIEVEGELHVCENGLHLFDATDDSIERWTNAGSSFVFEAEVEGELLHDLDKWVARRVRLVRGLGQMPPRNDWRVDQEISGRSRQRYNQRWTERWRAHLIKTSKLPRSWKRRLEAIPAKSFYTWEVEHRVRAYAKTLKKRDDAMYALAAMDGLAPSAALVARRRSTYRVLKRLSELLTEMQLASAVDMAFPGIKGKARTDRMARYKKASEYRRERLAAKINVEYTAFIAQIKEE